MKKLLMSLIAVAMMSTAAFASSGEKASAKEPASSKFNFKTMKEVTVNKASRRTLCRLTVSIYNTSGQLIDTQVVTHTIYDGGNNMFYNSCSEFFTATIQNYQNYYGNPNR